MSMSNKMLLTTKLEQRLVMSQQLTQAITLLQYNTLDLKQLVQRYIESNPMLEVDETETTDHDTEDLTHFFNYSAEINRAYRYDNDDSTLENYSIPKSLRDHLFEQTLLCKFDTTEQVVAEAIIDAIDESGYLTMTIPEIREALAELGPPDLAMIEKILKKIQTFDPAGVAAANLRECLLIQLDHLSNKNQSWKVAHDCLKNFFDLLAEPNSKK